MVSILPSLSEYLPVHYCILCVTFSEQINMIKDGD